MRFISRSCLPTPLRMGLKKSIPSVNLGAVICTQMTSLVASSAKHDTVYARRAGVFARQMEGPIRDET
jgi:hypothetical protein